MERSTVRWVRLPMLPRASRSRSRLCAAALLLSAAGLLSGCLAERSYYTLRFENASGEDVRDVQVSWARLRHSLGRIEPGVPSDVLYWDSVPRDASLRWVNASGQERQQRVVVPRPLPDLGDREGYEFQFLIGQERVVLQIRKNPRSGR